LAGPPVTATLTCVDFPDCTVPVTRLCTLILVPDSCRVTCTCTEFLGPMRFTVPV
jgi:hypothetical protein